MSRTNFESETVMRKVNRPETTGVPQPHAPGVDMPVPASRKLEMLCPSHRRVLVDVPHASWAEMAGMNPCNPSVHAVGDALWCTVRAVNYSYRGGAFAKPVSDCLRSQNLLCRLEPGTYRVLSASWMRDRHPGPRRSSHAIGYEDLRLHDVDGKLWASATACDFSGGLPQMMLLHLSEGGDVALAEVQTSGGGRDPSEKNWMPILGRGHQWVYSSSPTVVRAAGSPTPVSTAACAPPIARALSGCKGSSQLLPLGGGAYLAVVHDSTGGRWRSYRHRFVRFAGEPLRAVAASEPFLFAGRLVEFCAGLARVGDRLVLSYGLEDCEAWLSEVRESEALALLSENLPQES